jgi:purine-binding chemotaxis protein CheW
MPVPSHPPRGSSVDWTETRARLDRANVTVSTEPPATEIAATLRARARILAHPLTQPDQPAGDAIEVVAFQLGEQRFALEAAFVREAVFVLHVTLLPGMPATLRGLANVRSRIVPIFDLRTLLLVTAVENQRTRETVLVMGFEGADFGLVVDEVLGPRQMQLSRLRSEVPGLQSQYLRGLGDDAIVLLDVPAITAALTIDGRGP